ncbi:MAG: BlaI/MecI/CopY family transcriptional regulator [Bacteroidales bacterium]|jgi:predicted transcriptional regulator|nr:BlaI/MecI/CopY family transcriptional regulator [Bacteroidales bacterium]
MKKNEIKIRELTRAEEQVMQVLWKIEKGMVNDILRRFPDPKPAYNTVSTVTRILEQKGFVDHKAYGHTHQYFPLISRKDYTRLYLSNFLQNYFENSFQSLASFFAKEEKPSLQELEEIQKLIGQEINLQKNQSHE